MANTICRTCGQPLEYKDRFRGLLRCPECGDEMPVGPERKLVCPGCRGTVNVCLAEGTNWKCPHCDEMLVIRKSRLAMTRNSLPIAAFWATLVVTITTVVLTDITFFVFSFPLLFLLYFVLFQFGAYLLGRSGSVEPLQMTATIPMEAQSPEEPLPENVPAFPPLMALVVHVLSDTDNDLGPISEAIAPVVPFFNPAPFLDQAGYVTKDMLKADIQYLSRTPAPIQADFLRAIAYAAPPQEHRAFILKTAVFLKLPQNVLEELQAKLKDQKR